MIRATTGGVMRSYRSNLMNSFINMNASRNTVLTQRTFNSFAEDPAAAAKAFRLRKSRMTVESQYSICTDTLKKYETAVACLQSIDDVMCTKDGIYGEYMTTLTGTTLEMLNDPTGDAREQLSKVLDQLSQSVVQVMNQKYGDNFIFSGADGHNVAFEIVDDVLYYRGVPVDADVPSLIKGEDGNPLRINIYLDPPEVSEDSGPYVIVNDFALMRISKYESAKETGTAPPVLVRNVTVVDDETGEAVTTQEILRFNKNGEYDPEGEYYLNVEQADTLSTAQYDQQKQLYDKLQYLAGETSFVDIGYGFQEDPVTGKLIESSAFNAAINGLNFLGYGLDEDGDPRNLYSLAQRMREIADSATENDTWSENWDDFSRLVGKYEAAISDYQTEFVNLDASTGKLRRQQELLEDNFDNLQEQYSDLEDVDMVDAITSFIWAEYCYNAALKVGNNILSESLMDYLR